MEHFLFATQVLWHIIIFTISPIQQYSQLLLTFAHTHKYSACSIFPSSNKIFKRHTSPLWAAKETSWDWVFLYLKSIQKVFKRHSHSCKFYTPVHIPSYWQGEYVRNSFTCQVQFQSNHHNHMINITYLCSQCSYVFKSKYHYLFISICHWLKGSSSTLNRFVSNIWWTWEYVEYFCGISKNLDLNNSHNNGNLYQDVMYVISLVSYK